MTANRHGKSFAPAAPVGAEHAVASVIGHRYRVIEQLGRGGTAVVYRVSDAGREAELALKQLVLRESSDTRQMRVQFENEFHVLAQLSHPSVIAVHDYGIGPAGPYYTMELLDGGDVSTLAPMNFRSVCELALQLCSSLSLLHSRKLVHRDVSPRNVRCTRQGSAKLIDFGAMVPFGPCVQVVGTPSFVAPEVVNHLGLDARTDLFSLGATLYFALTGRKPFAARVLAELQEAWREPPLPPSHFVPTVPAALDALVLSLLRIDPGRRPRSAFEVIQRLTALIGTAQAEPAQITQAYVSAPALVGRDAEQRRFRHRMQTALQAEGGSLFFCGEPGLGRTRLLETCMIEAKLAGATVLRVNGRAAPPTAFAGAYAIAEQVLENVPELAVICAQTANVDGTLLVAPGADAAPSRARLLPLNVLAGDRGRLQRDLTAWLSAVCEQQPLVVALDDVERIDEASLSWLAAWMHGASRLRRLIVVTSDVSVDTGKQPALRTLREQALVRQLAPLTAAQTEALIMSIFLDAPHTALLSNRLQRAAAGNPRESMALVRSMLDRQQIRYAEGSWVLPAELALADLPANAEEAVRARVALLPDLARRIAQTQALAFEGPWLRSDYLQIAAGQPAREVEAALALLVRDGVLVNDGSSYTLSNLGVRSCLLAGSSEHERAECHRVLTELCVHSRRPVLVEVHHRSLAGDAKQALDRLMALLASTPSISVLREQSSLDRWTVAAILKRAKVQATALGRRAREIHELNQRLVDLSLTTEVALYRAHGPAWLAQLERDSGLIDYRQLGPELAHNERLRTALQRVTARYDATPEHERVYPPEEAQRLLAHFVIMALTVAAKTNDMRMYSGFAALLAPLASLSPFLEVSHRYAIAISQLHQSAQPELAAEALRAIYLRLDRLTEHDFAYLHSWRHSAAAAAAAAETAVGDPRVERWLPIVESSPLDKPRALGMRRVLCLFDADAMGAEQYRKQFELLVTHAEHSGLGPVPLFIDLAAHVHAGELDGVKRLCDRLEQLAHKEPGWRPLHQLAHASFQRLRGDFSAALEAVESVLRASDPAQLDPPPQLNVWVAAVTEQIVILTELGRAQEARDIGIRACAQCEAVQIVVPAAGLWRALALAEATLGDYVQATVRLDALIRQRAQIRPALLAVDYEARARVAIAAKDFRMAAYFVRLATRHLTAGAELPARYGRLIDDAERAGVQLDLPVSDFESTVLGSERPPATHAFAEKIESLNRLRDSPQRAQRVLELLANAAGASSGYLYYVRPAGLVCTASLDSPPDADLDRFANGYFQQQLESAAMTTVFTELGDAFESASWTNTRGSVYRIVLVQCAGGSAYAGLVALRGVDASELSAEYRALSNGLGTRLLALGDVQRVDTH